MKEVFAITTYCNTKHKLKILNETIENLKKFNVDIFIHAHYPLSDDIQKKVNYYFYSSDNPVLNRYNVYWYDDIKNYRFEYKQYDYSYTVMKQWKESIDILSNYDVIHFVNYDINITKELYDLTLTEINRSNKSIFYENFISKEYIHVAFFSILNKDFKSFNSILSKDAFFNFKIDSNFLPSLESYMINNISKIQYVKIEYDRYKHMLLDFLKNEVSMESYSDNVSVYSKNENNDYYHINDYFVFTIKENYSIFIGYYYDLLVGIIYDIKKDINFELNDTKMIISQKADFFQFNIQNNLIKINDEIIDKNFIDSFLKMECKIYDR